MIRHAAFNSARLEDFSVTGVLLTIYSIALPAEDKISRIELSNVDGIYWPAVCSRELLEKELRI